VNEMSPEGLDALKEIINIGIGLAAGSLNEMLQTPILLEAPEISMARRSCLKKQILEGRDENLSCVYESFSGGIDGRAILLFAPTDAAKLIAVLTGEDQEDEDLDALKAGTLTEVGNIVINCVLGTFGNLLDRQFTFQLPVYLEGGIDDVLPMDLVAFEPAIVLMKTRFKAKTLDIGGNILLVFELKPFDALLQLATHVFDLPESEA